MVSAKMADAMSAGPMSEPPWTLRLVLHAMALTRPNHSDRGLDVHLTEAEVERAKALIRQIEKACNRFYNMAAEVASRERVGE